MLILDDSNNRLNFHLLKRNVVRCKDHLKSSETAKLGSKNLLDSENITLQIYNIRIILIIKY